MKKFKRVFDLIISVPLLLLLSAPMLLIGLLVRMSSNGSALYWSMRVGYEGKIFLMPKYRTMLINTPEVATAKLDNAQIYVTSIGKFLRKSSLDELPQLWSIVKGDMSLVGPRPALHNQDDLNALRSKYGINFLIPGLTGWAQVNGRDNLSIEDKVAYDVEYLSKKSIYFDIYILCLTVNKVFSNDDISH